MIDKDWIKPQGCESATCLEIRVNDVGEVVLRQTTRPRDVIAVDAIEFAAFLAAAKAGFYDGLAASD